MKTHFSIEVDEAAAHVETGTEACVREHHLGADGVRIELILLGAAAAGVILVSLLAPRFERTPFAETPAAHTLHTRAPVSHWRGAGEPRASTLHEAEQAEDAEDARGAGR